MVNKTLLNDYFKSTGTDSTASDVPIRTDVRFHLILSLIADCDDYNTAQSARTSCKFRVYWDTIDLTPEAMLTAKEANLTNVKFALSIGGYGVKVNGNENKVFFKADAVDSWVKNAEETLKPIIENYHIDGIEIDYEQFFDANDTVKFTECIGMLITNLKQDGAISFASITQCNNSMVRNMYRSLWQRYHCVIDYVYFQIDEDIAYATVNQYIQLYNQNEENNHPGKIITSFSTDNNGNNVILANLGLYACMRLKRRNKLNGIFVPADYSHVRGKLI